MTTKDKLTAQWASECGYISKITDMRGQVVAMNNCKATFIRYCEMQKASATRQGFHDSATYIQHCIDDLS